VLAAAAARGIHMEINASPERLDLKDLHARMAKEKGMKLVINTMRITLRIWTTRVSGLPSRGGVAREEGCAEYVAGRQIYSGTEEIISHR